MNIIRWLARLFGPPTPADWPGWTDADRWVADIPGPREAPGRPKVWYIDDHYITPIYPGEDEGPLT